MEEALLALIVGDAGVTALVPRTSAAWGVRKGLPAISLHLIWSKPNVTHDGPSGLDVSTVQVSCWGSTAETAVKIRRAVSRLLAAYKSAGVLNLIMVEGGGGDDDQGEGPTDGAQPAKIHHQRLDLRVWHLSL